jgi:hypothetical protein
MRRRASGRDRLHQEGKKMATSRKHESKSPAFSFAFLEEYLDERKELNPTVAAEARLWK